MIIKVKSKQESTREISEITEFAYFKSSSPLMNWDAGRRQQVDELLLPKRNIMGWE